MRKLAVIQADIETAIAEYSAARETKSALEAETAGQIVKLLRQEFSSTIVEGANPCDSCGQEPIGIEQPLPRPRGRVEYEVGCQWCPPVEHTDGTVRQRRVRCGPLPKNAVEAWNAGPDAWLKKEIDA